MSYAPIFPDDARPVAEKLKALMAPILGARNPPIRLPPVSNMDVASADHMLLARGLQFRQVRTAAGSTVFVLPPPPTLLSFVDTPFTSVNWTPHMARRYWFETNMTFRTGATPGLARIRFVVGGQGIDDDEAKSFLAANTHGRVTFTVPVTVSSTSPVNIKWQWLGAAGQTLTVDENHMCALKVWA